jgi:UTP:GlnB (protein PII) uridylyltransferase
MMGQYFDAADHVRRCAEIVEGAVMGEPEPEGWGAPFIMDGLRVVPGGTVTAEHRLLFEEDPGRLVRLFRICQIHEARPDRALSLLVRERAHLLTPEVALSEESCSALRAMLTEGGRVYATLNALREHGLLYRLVPEFAGLHCLVQFEFYHRWTADVHTLRCLRELDRIYAGESLVEQKYREVVLGSEAPSLLYAILFLHDIAKSGGIEGHAERGVPIADRILERLGFDAREREIASGVIRHHLVMGLYWQRHDIDDPANIERFASIRDATRAPRRPTSGLTSRTASTGRSTAARWPAWPTPSTTIMPSPPRSCAPRPPPCSERTCPRMRSRRTSPRCLRAITCTPPPRTPRTISG